MEFTQVAIAVGVPVLGAVVWLIRFVERLEGRVDGHEALLGRIDKQLEYIVHRIDRALNGEHD